VRGQWTKLSYDFFIGAPDPRGMAPDTDD